MLARDARAALFIAAPTPLLFLFRFLPPSFFGGEKTKTEKAGQPAHLAQRSVRCYGVLNFGLDLSHQQSNVLVAGHRARKE